MYRKIFIIIIPLIHTFPISYVNIRLCVIAFAKMCVWTSVGQWTNGKYKQYICALWSLGAELQRRPLLFLIFFSLWEFLYVRKHWFIYWNVFKIFEKRASYNKKIKWCQGQCDNRYINKQAYAIGFKVSRILWKFSKPKRLCGACCLLIRKLWAQCQQFENEIPLHIKIYLS